MPKPELLDANKVLEWFVSSPPTFSLQDCLVDAEPVVRCKDCRWGYYESNVIHCCTLHKGLAMVTPDSYCSYGEKRKTEEE